MTRLALALAGLVTMAWAVAVTPTLWSEIPVLEVASAVAAGESFKPEILTAVSEEAGVGRLRPSAQASAAVISVRQAENAIRDGDLKLIDVRLMALDATLDRALRNAPADAFLWLVRFWRQTTRHGTGPDDVSLLRMSYDLGPREGWVAVRRNGVALASFAALPADLAQRTVSEFAALVRWNFLPEATDLAASVAPTVRAALFSGLTDINIDQRRAFANVFYSRELDEVPVPGIDPPVPDIALPVLPPDL